MEPAALKPAHPIAARPEANGARAAFTPPAAALSRPFSLDWPVERDKSRRSRPPPAANRPRPGDSRTHMQDSLIGAQLPGKRGPRCGPGRHYRCHHDPSV